MSTIRTKQEGSHEAEASRPDVKAPVKKAASAFRTISEVADELHLQQHVLRFWETKFSQIKPLKRGGGRRYYRPEDVALLKKIHNLLYTEGYTIKGVQKLLRGGPAEKPTPAAVAKATAQPQAPLSGRQKAILELMLGDLKELRNLIKGE